MKRSTQRILTTHVGSLPRPPDLLQMIQAKERGEPLDAGAFARRVASAVAEVVRKQADSGIDVVADGEMGRFGFIPYVNERLAGIEPRKNAGRDSNWAQSREYLAFPEYYQWASQMPGAAGSNPPTQWVCTGPIAYRGRDALQRDIGNLKAALTGVTCEEAFMPAVSPSNLANWNTNEYYKSDEEFRIAIADALHEEYRAIVDAGLVLQIDDPQLASHWAMHPEIDLAECRRWAGASVEILNHALRGIPADRVRYHTCYSINMGPRVHDMELKHIVDIMLEVRAGAYSFEAANPRHEHEWRIWEAVNLPEGKALIPGIVTHASNLVEHPETVAQRIARFAGAVGRENVIAGADCGFASFSTSCEVHPTVVWAKLAALAEGARLATSELWGRD
jgi:5-methyltetrahydropteroyltriglutamate--homocysteine methyltransferase